MTSLVWFRRDLRLGDNPALTAAVARGGPVVPLFILEPNERPGGASGWWLHHSLTSLGAACARLGAPLVLRHGKPQEVLSRLVAETGATHLFWNRCYEPAAIARDREIKESVAAQGLNVQSFKGALLAEPWEIKSGAGEPYKVFTPFWRALNIRAPFVTPLATPKTLKKSEASVASDELKSWSLLPISPDWSSGFPPASSVGERAASERLADFLGEDASAYASARDRMDKRATSCLAAQLHWGEISPRQIWQAASMHADAHPQKQQGIEAFKRQLGWREFSVSLLFHWPHMEAHAWKAPYDHFPWATNDAHFKAWTKGETGYPIVDAAMRCLWTTGNMHNRARMLVASFLVKHLLIDWRRGAEWFEDTLLDADLANNRSGWQWVAGSGADASPYFRIFNPILQGEKFDPDGTFTKAWLPELARLDLRHLQKPWSAPLSVLKEAGVTLGKTYPNPIVDHDTARARALAALATMKKDQLTDE